MNEIADFIKDVGFPIAACVFMFIQNNKLQGTLTNISIAMQKMADEISDLEDKINNN